MAQTWQCHAVPEPQLLVLCRFSSVIVDGNGLLTVLAFGCGTAAVQLNTWVPQEEIWLILSRLPAVAVNERPGTREVAAGEDLIDFNLVLFPLHR